MAKPKKKTISENPRIYVACLASYNAGKLHGTWIDVTNDPTEIQEQISEMLRESPCPNVMVKCPACDGECCAKSCTTCKGKCKVPSAEEWAIHDHENFQGYEVSEHESLETIAGVAEGIEKHGEAFSAYLGYDKNYNKPEDFEERYRGSFPTFREFSDEIADEQIACFTAGNGSGYESSSDKRHRESATEFMSRYFDYEAFARDLEHDFLVIDGETQVHVFDSN